MPMLGTLAALAAFGLAWCGGWLILKFGKVPLEAGRFASIDGLRGFLAFSVFLHHSAVWLTVVRTGVWATPSSPLYRHFGDSAVALFFMITAFLFTGKVLASQPRQIDWLRLYVGRITRLFPMYAVAVAIVWLLTWQMTGWRLQVTPSVLATEALGWIGFTIGGIPAVNGANGGQQMAWVTWSLAYEWWFYLSLPLLAWLFRRRPPWLLLGISVVSIGLFQVGWLLAFERATPFLGGIIAALPYEAPFFARSPHTGPAGL